MTVEVYELMLKTHNIVIEVFKTISRPCNRAVEVCEVALKVCKTLVEGFKTITEGEHTIVKPYKVTF